MNDFWYSLEGSELAFQIGATWWFPLIESIHVLAAVLVLGSILMVDLRLMGVAAARYSSSILLRELVPWSWAAFAVALVSGGLLFIVQASNYASNTAFLIKLLLLGLAGLNMVWFHWRVLPWLRADERRHGNRNFFGAKLSAAFSLMLWSGIMLAGRWIGHLV